MAGSLIFSVLYGYKITSKEDPYLQLAEEFMTTSTYAISGGWVVDFVPFRSVISLLDIHQYASNSLLLIVRWVPGISGNAPKWKSKMEGWVNIPYSSFTKDVSG